ncbi:hypothetical protein HJ01_00708 [Flavobacterium frigoris PS1]|uniref:Uncharacterized protein n=1 Tax=Flavobacterium frigoris (strain PS1) TaxID=1086011 RepID=H7FNN7_FLAFP|nr:hypothetical protein HJ01_00708 [Flavobacterium frigoris PS1]
MKPGCFFFGFYLEVISNSNVFCFFKQTVADFYKELIY